MYIYAGKRALEVAPQHRLKVIVDRMRPLLRQGDYNRALEEGIVNLGLILSGGEPGGQPGEPRQKGEGSYWGLGVFLAIFAGVMGLTGWYIPSCILKSFAFMCRVATNQVIDILPIRCIRFNTVHVEPASSISIRIQ